MQHYNLSDYAGVLTYRSKPSGSLTGERHVVEECVSWLLAHPLEGVGALVVFAVGFGVILIPRVHEVVTHGHPRC